MFLCAYLAIEQTSKPAQNKSKLYVKLISLL